MTHSPHEIHKEGPAEPGCLGAADQTALHGPQSPASLGDTEQRHCSTRRPCDNTVYTGGQREDESFPSGLEVELHRRGLLTYSESRQGFSVCAWEAYVARDTLHRDPQEKQTVASKGSLRTAEEQVAEASR